MTSKQFPAPCAAVGDRAVTSVPERSSGRLRGGRLAVLVLQAFAFAAIPAVDAALDADLLGVATHVEGRDREHCDPGHSHLLCQLTRTLLLGTSSPGLADFGPTPEALPSAMNATAPTVRPALSGGSGPRAPPTD